MKSNKAKPNTAGHSKKLYRAPRLVVYGDLRRLTKAKQGTNSDGGGHPHTKNPPG